MIPTIKTINNTFRRLQSSCRILVVYKQADRVFVRAKGYDKSDLDVLANLLCLSVPRANVVVEGC